MSRPGTVSTGRARARTARSEGIHVVAACNMSRLSSSKPQARSFSDVRDAADRRTPGALDPSRGRRLDDLAHDRSWGRGGRSLIGLMHASELARVGDPARQAGLMTLLVDGLPRTCSP